MAKVAEGGRRQKTQKVSKAAVTVIPENQVVSESVPAKAVVIPGGAVVYVGRIPHGFFEEEMREYFSQFGEITRLRLSRNKKTGESKHYAFIEFRHEAVAKVVVETMHNYLLFNHLLQCKVIPNDKVHPEMFKGANKKFRPVQWKKIAREKYNAEKSPEELEVSKKRAIERRSLLQQKLKDLGITYELPA